MIIKLLGIRKISIYSCTNTLFKLELVSTVNFINMEKYFNRLKNKLKIKKLNSEQPVRAWIFVLVLNVVGFVGYIYLKINNISLNN